MRDVAEGFVLDLVADTEGATEEVGLIDTALVLPCGCGYMYSTRSRGHAIGYIQTAKQCQVQNIIFSGYKMKCKINQIAYFFST